MSRKDLPGFGEPGRSAYDIFPIDNQDIQIYYTPQPLWVYFNVLHIAAHKTQD